MSEWISISGAIVVILIAVGILLTLVLWKKRKEVNWQVENASTVTARKFWRLD